MGRVHRRRRHWRRGAGAGPSDPAVCGRGRDTNRGFPGGGGDAERRTCGRNPALAGSVPNLKNEATDLHENKGSGSGKVRNEATLEGGKQSSVGGSQSTASSK